MKRCILHLGMPKTASTSIQVTLSKNRDLLQEYGWEYPSFSCPEHGYTFYFHNDPLCRLFAPMHPFHSHRDVKNGKINLDLQQKELSKSLTNFCDNCNKIVLSSEALLYPLPLQRIKNFMESRGYKIEPIVYIRSPYSYRVSLYQSFLKFSQHPKSTIIERLQDPLVKASVKTLLDVFGESAKLYPFNYLGRNGEDVVNHFFSHLLEKKECWKIKIIQENQSVSRQATALLGYVEEKNPMYINNVKSENREPGDIKPLHTIIGEKFIFDQHQLAPYRKIIDRENIWLEKILGEEFCDNDYMSNVADGPVEWGEESITSLLVCFLRVPVPIQKMMYDYFQNDAKYVSPSLKQWTLKRLQKKLRKNKQVSGNNWVKQLFPSETKRGQLARKFYREWSL